jgi:DNA uptake protein ComE-like DNA-binding protein
MKVARISRLVPFLAALFIAFLVLPERAAAAKAKGKIDLNTATQKELQDLPGVGEATAKKIIAGRPYSSVDDLEKAGLSKTTIGKIRPLVEVGKTSAAAPAPSSARSVAGATKSSAETPEKKPSKMEKAASAVSAAAGPVDLNAATDKQLEDLPGVGKATAKKIIAGRPYSSVDDLSKAGVSKGTIDKIRPLVTVGAAAAAAAKPAETSPRKSSVPAAPSSAPAAAAPASAPASAASSAPDTSRSTAASASRPAQPPPARGMVWVNTATKVYHYEGDRWYGNTKEGKYMTEQEAIAAGYRASKEKPKK